MHIKDFSRGTDRILAFIFAANFLLHTPYIIKGYVSLGINDRTERRFEEKLRITGLNDIGKLLRSEEFRDAVSAYNEDIFLKKNIKQHFMDGGLLYTGRILLPEMYYGRKKENNDYYQEPYNPKRIRI